MIVRAYRGKSPKIATSAFVAEGAVIIGDVEIGEQASIWYGCVLRADVGHIRVGARSNVQDGSCLHMTSNLSHAVIGEDVTVGHGAIVAVLAQTMSSNADAPVAARCSSPRRRYSAAVPIARFSTPRTPNIGHGGIDRLELAATANRKR